MCTHAVAATVTHSLTAPAPRGNTHRNVSQKKKSSSLLVCRWAHALFTFAPRSTAVRHVERSLSQHTSKDTHTHTSYAYALVPKTLPSYTPATALTHYKLLQHFHCHTLLHTLSADLEAAGLSCYPLARLTGGLKCVCVCVRLPSRYLLVLDS